VGTRRSERAWPEEGFVTVVSAEAQQGVFLDIRFVERLPETSALRALGQERWMAREPVKGGPRGAQRARF
jgi:hypothetical protein